MNKKQYKTSAKCAGCVKAIAGKLNEILPESAWSIDLNSPDRILTVNADIDDDAVINAVKAAGFKIEKILIY